MVEEIWVVTWAIWAEAIFKKYPAVFEVGMSLVVNILWVEMCSGSRVSLLDVLLQSMYLI